MNSDIITHAHYFYLFQFSQQLVQSPVGCQYIPCKLIQTLLHSIYIYNISNDVGMTVPKSRDKCNIYAATEGMSLAVYILPLFLYFLAQYHFPTALYDWNIGGVPLL